MPFLPGDELARIVDELKELPHGTALADLAVQSLLGQDSLPKPDKEPETSPEQTEEETSTPRGNVANILNQGPQSLTEAALVSGCLAQGIGQQMTRLADDESRQAYVEDLLPRLDELAATTPWAPFEGLAHALTETTAELFWNTAVVCLIEESVATEPQRAADQSLRFLVRADALGLAPATLKKPLAELVETRWPEDWQANARAVALWRLAPPPPPPEAAPPLAGELLSRPWGGVARVAAALTGVLLFRALTQLAARHLLGYGRPAEVTLDAGMIRLHHRVRCWGRVIKEVEETIPVADLCASRVEHNHRHLQQSIGVLGLVLGAALGVNYVVEGTCAAYPPLILLGFTLIGAGVILELLLDHLLPRGRHQQLVSLSFGQRQVGLRVDPAGEVGRFVDVATEQRLALAQSSAPPSSRDSTSQR